MFVLNSEVDTAQLAGILQLPCLPPNCSDAEMKYFYEFVIVSQLCYAHSQSVSINVILYTQVPNKQLYIGIQSRHVEAVYIVFVHLLVGSYHGVHPPSIQEFLDQAGPAILSSGTGVFIDSCLIHCQTLTDTPWMSYAVNGLVMRDAFAAWFDGGVALKAVDNALWPNNKSCGRTVRREELLGFRPF